MYGRVAGGMRMTKGTEAGEAGLMVRSVVARGTEERLVYWLRSVLARGTESGSSSWCGGCSWAV